MIVICYCPLVKSLQSHHFLVCVLVCVVSFILFATLYTESLYQSMYFQIFLPAQGYVYWLNLSWRSGQGMLDQVQEFDWYFAATHRSLSTWVVTNLKYQS